MANMLIQPKGSVSKETNKQSIARIHNIKNEQVHYVEVGLDISSLKYLFEPTSEIVFSLEGDETGTIQSFSVNGNNTLTIKTDTNDYILNKSNVITASELISTGGASMIGTNNSMTVQEKLNSLTRRVNVLDFMTDEEREGVLSYSGTADNSNAFVQAFATGAKLIDVPAGRYLVQNVTIPTRTRLFGDSGYKPYNVTSDASFYDTGTLIRKINGAANMFLWNTACGAQDIMFDGYDRASPAINSATGGKITVGFQRCGFYRWDRVGNRLGAYLGCTFQFCNFNQNNIGIYNTVDGNHISCTINANKNDGVRLETGADSNTFTNCRNEWNEGNNWNFYGCVSIQVINELCDRAFLYGFRISNSNVQIQNVDVRRSGRTASSDATSAHFYIENSIVKMIGVKTSAGPDDTGGSVVVSSPAYIFRMEGANSGSLTLTSNRMTGSTIGIYSGSPRPETMRYSDNDGIEDFCNVGLYRKNGGKQYRNFQSASGVPGSSPINLTFTTSSVATYNNDLFNIDLTWRNSSNGGSNGAQLSVISSREGGNASYNIINIVSKNGVLAETDVNTSPGANQLYQVTITPVEADGSIFTLSFIAKSTNTSTFSLKGYLR